MHVARGKWIGGELVEMRRAALITIAAIIDHTPHSPQHTAIFDPLLFLAASLFFSRKLSMPITKRKPPTLNTKTSRTRTAKKKMPTFYFIAFEKLSSGLKFIFCFKRTLYILKYNDCQGFQ